MQRSSKPGSDARRLVMDDVEGSVGLCVFGVAPPEQPGEFVNSTVLNIAALFASLLALAISSFLALRQSRLMRDANQLPVVIDLFRELRADTFITREQEIWHSLPGEQDPSKGFGGIPTPLRTYAYDICLYYQTVAYLVNFKMLDNELAYTALHYRILRTWSSVEPFVRGERAIRGGENTFLNSLETLAKAIGDEHLRRDGPKVLEKIKEETELTRFMFRPTRDPKAPLMLRASWKKIQAWLHPQK